MHILNNEEARVLCKSQLSLGKLGMLFMLFTVICPIEVTVMSCPNQLRCLEA